MEIHHYHEGEILIVVPSGKLDTTHAPDFLKRIEELFVAQPNACLIDLSQITFLASSGLKSILTAAKISQKAEMQFGLFGMQEMSYNVFTMAGFNQFIKSFNSKEEALANLI